MLRLNVKLSEVLLLRLRAYVCRVCLNFSIVSILLTLVKTMRQWNSAKAQSLSAHASIVHVN